MYTEIQTKTIGTMLYDINTIKSIPINKASNCPSLISNIIDIMPDVKYIVHIFFHEGDINVQKRQLGDIVNLFETVPDTIVVIEAYISPYVYPEKEYDYNGLISTKKNPDKKQIPYLQELRNQGKIFESLGFIDFSKFRKFDKFRIAYILGTDYGKMLIKLAEEYEQKLESSK